MSQTVLTLFTRPQCHLCEQAKQALNELKTDFTFILEEIDINQSDELTERYGLMIPVILMNGEEVAFGQINKYMISKRLHEVF